jgi:hypothetical protein
VDPICERIFYKKRYFRRERRKNGGWNFEGKFCGQSGPESRSVCKTNTGGIFRNIIVVIFEKSGRGRGRRGIFG